MTSQPLAEYRGTSAVYRICARASMIDVDDVGCGGVLFLTIDRHLSCFSPRRARACACAARGDDRRSIGIFFFCTSSVTLSLFASFAD